MKIKFLSFLSVLIFSVSGLGNAQSSLSDCVSGPPAGADIDNWVAVCTTIVSASQKQLEITSAIAAYEAAREQAEAGESQSDIAKSAAEVAKATAEAEKAAIETAAAAKYADLNAFNDAAAKVSSNTSGTVELKEGAAKFEAELLSTKSLTAMADEICSQFPVSRGPNKSIVQRGVYIMLNGEQDPRAALYLYNFREEHLKNLLNETNNIQSKADADYTAFLYASTRDVIDSPFRSAADVDVLGLASTVSAGATLLDLFKTDYSVGGVSVTPNQTALANATGSCLLGIGELNSANPKVFKAYADSIYDFRSLSAKFTEPKVVSDLDDAYQKLLDLAAHDAKVKKASTALAAIERKSLGDDGAKAAYDTAKASTKAALDAYSSTKAAYDALIGEMVKPASPIAISQIARSQAFEEISDDVSVVLELEVIALGGTYYTKRNLWSALGTMPFKVAGGGSTRFAYYDKSTGRLEAAGVARQHSGFYSVDKLQRCINQDAINCRKSRASRNNIRRGPRGRMKN